MYPEKQKKPRQERRASHLLITGHFFRRLIESPVPRTKEFHVFLGRPMARIELASFSL